MRAAPTLGGDARISGNRGCGHDTAHGHIGIGTCGAEAVPPVRSAAGRPRPTWQQRCLPWTRRKRRGSARSAAASISVPAETEAPRMPPDALRISSAFSFRLRRPAQGSAFRSGQEGSPGARAARRACWTFSLVASGSPGTDEASTETWPPMAYCRPSLSGRYGRHRRSHAHCLPPYAPLRGRASASRCFFSSRNCCWASRLRLRLSARSAPLSRFRRRSGPHGPAG